MATQEELERSRAENGRRYYLIKTGYYNGLSTSLNAKKGRPTGVGTKAETLIEIPLAENVPLSEDGTHRLLSYDEWRLTDEEFDEIFEHPNSVEVTREEWEAAFPPEEPA